MNELIPAGTITTFGLAIQGPLTNEQRLAIADKALLMGQAEGWIVADLAKDIVTNFPDTWRLEFAGLAERLGKSRGTIYNHYNTGVVFPTLAEREALLDSGVHFNKCRRLAVEWLSADQREGLLAMCREGMTMEELDAELYRLKNGQPKLPGPSRDVLRVRYDEWLVTLNEADQEYARYYVSLFVDWLEEQT